MSRNPAALDFPAEVELAEGDFRRPDDLLSVLDGVSQVFLLLGPDDGVDFLPIAVKAGVEGVVLLSSYTASPSWPSPDNPIARRHRTGERAVRESGLPFTVLRAAPFTTNVLLWTDFRDGELIVAAPYPDLGLPYVTPGDIAAVAANALIDGNHRDLVQLITGPGRLTPPGLARALGRVLARPVRYTELSPEQAADALATRLPSALVAPVLEALGPAAASLPISPAVTESVGRPARGFQRWAAEHQDLFDSVTVPK